MKYFLLLTLLSCVQNKAPDVVIDPITPPVATTPEVVQEWKTPKLILPTNSSKAMIEAVNLFNIHANSDEFYSYLRANVKTLSGGNYTDVELAITKFRQCLNKGEAVKITWYNYGPFSRVIGGWTGYGIVQNPKTVMTATQRAGHYIHEYSHACQFSHISNDIVKYPIIKNSFSYQLGYKFQSFLIGKQTKLAGNL